MKSANNLYFRIKLLEKSNILIYLKLQSTIINWH
jgi:hypothetical protein